MVRRTVWLPGQDEGRRRGGGAGKAFVEPVTVKVDVGADSWRPTTGRSSWRFSGTSAAPTWPARLLEQKFRGWVQADHGGRTPAGAPASRVAGPTAAQPLDDSGRHAEHVGPIEEPRPGSGGGVPRKGAAGRPATACIS